MSSAVFDRTRSRSAILRAEGGPEHGQADNRVLASPFIGSPQHRMRQDGSRTRSGLDILVVGRLNLPRAHQPDYRAARSDISAPNRADRGLARRQILLSTETRCIPMRLDLTA